ncbi:restriction endonuclease subunit S [Marinobacter salarius]|jgi:type I restriction enzyme S subunit|uniref:restriction endonuclease subunit S n=1 Tax=Marinobacter salarius TaxID=1420917 RepID=UPI00241D750E|nr:restriction endonuclease subunit S [Marinobacter salarius]
MGSEWRELSLEEIAEVIDSRHKTPTYSESGLPMVRVVDIKGGVLDLRETKRVSEEIYQDFSRGRDPKVGDLVISRVGSFGNISYISSNDRFCLGQNTAFIIPKENSRFLYYQLISPEVQRQIEQMAVGAVQKTISLKSIKQLCIGIPARDKQDGIANILGALDDKIALNHQINTTLESMAQALFKSWFVDFDPVIDNALAAGNPIPEELKARAEIRAALGDQRRPLPDHIRQEFPDRFVVTEEMGWVPEGWKIAPLSQIAALKTQSAHPSREPDKVWTHFSIPAFDDGMNPSYDLGETIKSGKYEVPKTAILASKLNPQFPRIWMPDIADENSSVCSTEFMPFVPEDPAERPYIYSLFCSHIMQSEISNRVTGSTGSRQRVKPKEIAELPVLTPSQSLRLAFCDIACSFFEKKSVVQRENLALQKLRDTLLPKLLSGEIRVPEAKRKLEEMAL